MRKKKEKYEKQGTKQKSAGHSILHKHEQKLKMFNNKFERLSKINTHIKDSQKILEQHVKERSFKQLNNESLEELNIEIRRLQDSLEKLHIEKSSIESGADEVEYLLESADLIFKYSQLDEKEREYLNLNTSDDALNDIVCQKNNLVEEYMYKFEKSYISTKKIWSNDLVSCADCNEYFQIQCGFLVCPSCGLCYNSIEGHEELSYKEIQDYDYRPQFTYDKMTHLEDWLRRFQSKENRVIPQEILDKVILEARKERIKDLNILTEEKVKRYLKKLSLNEYYDNVIGIINRINGRPPFKLTTEVEEKIKTMFQQIQEPFEKYKPANRRNFLSYSYTLHKFFQILGLHEFSKYFPLLKSADKLRQQDDIFKKVVAEMATKDKSINWVFYPSI
jgi:hypothetical protein